MIKFPFSTTKTLIIWGILALVAYIFCYYPALNNLFVNWDDNVYITENLLIKSFSVNSLHHIFTHSFEGHYHPFTLISLAADYHFFGLNPKAYHFHNLLLHAINSLLVMWFVFRLTRNANIAGITAVFFIVHPMQTEVVAWATARKDLIYVLWMLTAMITYLKFLEKRKIIFYVLTLFSFIIALFSKGQAITLPFLLILIDFYHRRDFKNRMLWLEKLPFLLLTIIFGYLAIRAQQETGYMAKNSAIPGISEMMVYPALAYVMYFWKILLPLHLSAWYPYPEWVNGGIPFIYWLTLVPALGMLAFIVYLIRQNRRTWAFGLMFFTVNIAMFLKFVPVSNYIIADRYVYLASLGLFIPAAVALDQFLAGKKRHDLLWIVMLGIVFSWGTLTSHRVAVWKDSKSLLNDILDQHPKVYTALNARGDLLLSEGDTSGAMADFNRAIAVQPQTARAYANRGEIFFRQKKLKEALDDFNKAIESGTRNARIYSNRGIILEMNNDYSHSFQDFKMAVELDPTLAKAQANLGIAYYQRKDFYKAIEHLNKALQLEPTNYHALRYRGYANYNIQDYVTAIADLTRYISTDQREPLARAMRGMAYVRTNQKNLACEDFERAKFLGLTQVQAQIDKYCR